MGWSYISIYTNWNDDTVSLWFLYLRYMLPKRLPSEMVTQWVYSLYTISICYPRGYKVKWLNSEFMVCIPQVYATQQVTSEMIKQWVYGLYTSGICYPRGYKVKWLNSEFMVNVYLRYMRTQEVTKWNGDIVSLWFVYLRYMLPKRLQSEMTTVSLWFVYLRYMLPKRLQSEMDLTQWVYGLYSSGIYYPRGYKVKWFNSEFMICIPQVYATQEVTKWNDDTVRDCIP